MKKLGWLVGIASVLLFSANARAQINSGVPAPFAVHVWSVPGVVNHGGLGTVFACTNAGSTSATVGVEVFGPAGGAALNNAATTAISVAPSATVTFGTVGFTGISIDASLALGAVSKGSARILSTTSRGILCSAFLADSVNAPPSFGTNLTIAKKTTQKGQ